MPGIMPTREPIREDSSTGRAMRLYSSLVITPLSSIFFASRWRASGFSSALARISTRANRPMRHTARSSPIYSRPTPKVSRS